MFLGHSGFLLLSKHHCEIPEKLNLGGHKWTPRHAYFCKIPHKSHWNVNDSSELGMQENRRHAVSCSEWDAIDRSCVVQPPHNSRDSLPARMMICEVRCPNSFDGSRLFDRIIEGAIALPVCLVTGICQKIYTPFKLDYCVSVYCTSICLTI